MMRPVQGSYEPHAEKTLHQTKSTEAITYENLFTGDLNIRSVPFKNKIEISTNYRMFVERIHTFYALYAATMLKRLQRCRLIGTFVVHIPQAIGSFNIWLRLFTTM